MIPTLRRCKMQKNIFQLERLYHWHFNEMHSNDTLILASLNQLNHCRIGCHKNNKTVKHSMHLIIYLLLAYWFLMDSITRCETPKQTLIKPTSIMYKTYFQWYYSNFIFMAVSMLTQDAWLCAWAYLQNKM